MNQLDNVKPVKGFVEGSAIGSFLGPPESLRKRELVTFDAGHRAGVGDRLCGLRLSRPDTVPHTVAGGLLARAQALGHGSSGETVGAVAAEQKCRRGLAAEMTLRTTEDGRRHARAGSEPPLTFRAGIRAAAFSRLTAAGTK